MHHIYLMGDRIMLEKHIERKLTDAIETSYCTVIDWQNA